MKKKIPQKNYKWPCKKGVLPIFVLLISSGLPAFARTTGTTDYYQQTQQGATLQGKVTDDLGLPLVGASVTIKGGTVGTATDSTGSFTLQATKNSGSLVVSYTGYVTQELPFNGTSTLNIKLTAEEGSLNEVVVMGYGKQRKSDITGAVTAVNMNRITDVPVTNLSNALAGRAPGVTVTNTSGLAGASSSIRIRGSFNDPLFVIDGVIKDKQAFDALDPNEIDQMSMLKDAAAAAVYGAQAGDGVLVVTTKRGHAGKPTFQAQVSTTTGRPTQELLGNLTTATDELTYQNRVTAWNNEYNGRNDPLPNDQAAFDYFKDKSYNVNDWIWRNPGNQKYLMSVSGGSEKLTYYSMLSYTKEQGSYTRLDYKKFNLRTNISAKISDAISVNLNLAAAQQNPDRFYWPYTGDDDYNVGDFYRVTFNWPKIMPFYLNEDGSPASRVTPYPVLPAIGSWLGWNVIDMVDGERYIHTRRRQFNPTVTLDVKLDHFVKGLSTKFVGNYEANDYFRKKWLTFQTNYRFIPDPDADNPYVPSAPDPTKTSVFNFGQSKPFLGYEMANGWKYQIDWYLNYERKFGEHNINAMFIFEQAEKRNYDVSATGYGPVTDIDQMFTYSTSQGDRYGDAYETLGANQSWIGRVNYSYADRYIAEFSFRQDGRYEFGPERKWGFFPSGSLAWKISNESFFKQGVPWINELKLRASYGTTGNLVDINNDDIAPFLYQTYYSNNSGYFFGNNYYTGITPAYTPNPNITWAETDEKNIGVDFALLKNRLSGTVDVFKNTMKNILAYRTVTLPTTYGQGLAAENYAQRTFTGSEFSLQWQDYIGKLSYTVYGNIGYAKDRWDKLDPSNAAYYPGQPEDFRYPVGHPNDRIFGFEAEGLIRTQEQLDKLIDAGYNYYGRKPYLGAIIYKDVRGQNFSDEPDGKIDGNDVVLLSENGKPRINFGFGFNVSWKGLSVDAHFQGVGAYDRMISNLDGAGIRQWGSSQRLYYPIWGSDVWTPENTDAKYPRVIGQNWAESGAIGSSFWMRNGAYVRLKNLNIAYNIPGDWVKRLGLSSLQVFANGTNLFVFSDMTEFQDPEQDNYDSYPIMKTFTFGLNARF